MLIALHQLKPVCVDLSRVALQGQQLPDKARRAQDLLAQLTGILETQIQYDASVLDDKIAEYVFFPLHHLLRNQDAYPIRVVETIIKALRLLIQYGWKARISRDLSQQLLILLTFIVGGVPAQDGKQQLPKPEETILEGYRALTALIKAAGVSAKDPPLTDTNIIPSFGHAVSVILDGVTGGSTPEIQLEALQAILAVYITLKQDEVLATFFPGTVSSLSRLLSPPLSTKAQRRVLISGVNVLRSVLTKVLGDLKVRNLLKEAETDVEAGGSPPENAGEGKVLTPAWLRATVSQVKIALSSVLKLRNHDAADVQQALERLCITLLDECHQSLADCTSMLVESAMILREDHQGQDTAFGVPEIGDDREMFYGTSLQDLATIYPELSQHVNTAVYNWITNMPRVMQSSDERVKQHAIRNILKGQETISVLGIKSSNLEESLPSALRDSIVALVRNSKSTKVLNEVDMDQSLWRGSDMVQTSQELQTYRPVLLPQEGQRDTRRDVAKLIQNIGSPTEQTKLAVEMLPYIRDTTGVDQVSSYWLSFQLLKSSFGKTADVDDFLDLTDAAVDTATDDQESVFNELYSFSVSILDGHSDAVDEVDWRLEAIALEVTAFAASRLRTAFRPELIDVLYPVSTFLGSPQPELRSHAITTLNSLAISCEYGSVSELIIDNVDYMVNSVSLRLNQFDISPASTKVLTMMIRLTGPKLLPFLDDVVAGIFAALDNYHGYTSFVENLFGVLSEVVEQGVKSDRLLVEDSKSKKLNHKKRPFESSALDDMGAFLDKRAKRRRELKEEDDVEEVIRGHPTEAWNSAKTALDDLETRNQGDDEDSAPPNNEEVALPKTPTYTLLTKIASLTQHYLTSPTPTLRKRLLDLLAKVTPALAPDEDAFLPLVNEIWPVLISRLYDPEPYVVIATCEALAALCASAGDFLNTRFTTEWGDGLGRWCRRVRDEARRQKGVTGKRMTSSVMMKSSTIVVPSRTPESNDTFDLNLTSTRTMSTSPAATGLGQFASAAQIWKAAIGLLVAIVSHVQLDDEIFEQILDLLADDVLPYDGEARRALEVVNADAVWLMMWERGMIDEQDLPNTPVVEGVQFVRLRAPMEAVK